MKFTVDLECTPEEARKFLGLPDVAPMQQKIMEELEARMQDNIRSLDPETFVKTWFPVMIEGWGDLNKMFWSQMGVTAPGAGADTSSTEKAKKTGTR